MSKISMINKTNETVRLAVYQKPVSNPTLACVAWQIGAPPPGGTIDIEIPSDFSLKVKYSSDRGNPSTLDTTARVVAFGERTACFSIDSVSSQDGVSNGAVVKQCFLNMVANEVRVANNFSLGVEASIMRGGDPIFSPQVIWPGGVFMEDVRSSLYVAVIAQFTYKGQRLVQQEVSLTEIEVLEGDSLTVSGSKWLGYSLEKL